MKKALTPILFFAVFIGIISNGFSQQLVSSTVNTPRANNPFSRDFTTTKDIFRSAVFIENKDIYEPYKGQKVEYLLSNEGTKAFFTKQGLVYKLSVIEEENEAKEEKERDKGKNAGPEGAFKAHYYYVQMQWEGANPEPEIVTTGQQEGDQIYFKKNGDDHSTIHSKGYKKITYKELYPGIDVEYTIPDKGGIEYNLIVHPGADVSQVKMTYSGDVKAVVRNNNGNITIKTKGGNIIEHAPNSYYTSSIAVASPFRLKNKTIQFKLPDDYDRNQTLIIDPWVTTLTTLTNTEVGYIVDYDYLGNLYVYGGGGGTKRNPQEFKVTKYPFAGGAASYTFNGAVGAQAWNAYGTEYDPGSFAVDKPTGKVYIGQGVDAYGAAPYYAISYYPYITSTPYGANQIIRLDANGNYDNFISTIDQEFMEAWGFTYNCANSTILISGGSFRDNINFGILNPVSAAVSPINITGVTTNNASRLCDRQDIASLAQNTQGDVFAIFSEPAVAQNPDVGNKIYKLNASLTGNTWNTPAGYGIILKEFQNHPAYVNPEAATVGNCTGNGYNALAANNNYVFYYDGVNLEAFNAATGVVAGNTTISGGTLKYQGGIAVDNCNHVYVGSVGAIIPYTFNGTTFTKGTSISLGAGYTTQYVYDVRYNSSNNMLYATGTGFAGIYNATLSTTCVTNLLSIATTRACTSATATLTPSNTVSNPVFTYVWTDTLGNIVSQTNSTTSPTNTLSGVAPGKYYIKAYMNLNCAASFQLDSSYVGARLSMNANDTTICSGQPITLTANADTTGGTFTWTPGGTVAPSITVSPTDTTTYKVTYSICNAVDSSKIFVVPAPKLTVSNVSICSGDSVTVKAIPSVAGGTFSWSPGGSTADSFRVAPTGSITYHVTYTLPGCGAITDSEKITVTPGSTLTMSNSTITLCAGDSIKIYATPSVGGGTYSWSPGGATTDTILIKPAIGSTTFTVTYSLGGSCASKDSVIATVKPAPTLPNTNVTVCGSVPTQIIANPSVSGGTYSWSPGGATTDTILVSPTGSTTYTVTYNLNGCSATGSHIVNVSPQPTLSKSNISICDGKSGQLTATPSINGGTYSWSPGGASNGTITVSPTVTTPYTVTYTLNGCSVTANDTVTVSPAPTLPNASVTICGGVQTQLIANPSVSGGTYSWSPGGATTDTVVVNPTGSTTYTVTYNLNGCSATGSHIVKVNPQPTLSSANVSLCSGSSGQLVATPSINGGSYSWSPGGATTNSISVNSNGIYTVTYNFNGCSATATDTVTVSSQPTLPSTNIVFCSADSAELVADPPVGGGIYSWSPGGQTTDSILVKPTVSTTYTVTYNLNGCIATGTHVVKVNPQPTLSSSNISICQGSPGQLVAMPSINGGSYSWSPGGATTNSIPVTITGIYTVTYNLNGCSATATDTATVSPQPTLSNTSITFCAGDSAEIIAAPSVSGGTYSWSLGGATTDTILVKPAVSTTYTVTYNLNGCTATGSHTVNVKSQPTLNSSNLSLCPGKSGELIATPSIGGGTFSWSSGGATDSISVSPNGANTIYTVTYSLNGCSATANDTVSVLSGASLATYNVNVCAGNSVQISVPSAPGATYSWSPGGATTNAITVSPTAPVTYYTITYSLNGCSATGTDTVTVIPKPNAGPDQSAIPAGAVVTLAATGKGTWSSYSNNPGVAIFADSANPATTVSGLTIVGTYGFIWTVNGCSDSMTVSVGVDPRADYSTSGSACLNGCIGFKNASRNATHFQWYFPGAVPSSDTSTNPANVCYDSVGTYSVTLIAYNGPISDTLIRDSSITILSLPKDTIFQLGDSLVGPSGSYTYQWYYNDSVKIFNGTAQVYVPKISGNYTLVITDSNGCSANSDTVAFTLTGIATVENDVTAEVYPNPLLTGSWNLLVGNALIGSTVDIFDADGKRVYESLVVNQHSLIELNIAPGIYFMHINSSKYNFIRKLIRL